MFFFVSVNAYKKKKKVRLVRHQMVPQRKSQAEMHENLSLRLTQLTTEVRLILLFSQVFGIFLMNY